MNEQQLLERIQEICNTAYPSKQLEQLDNLERDLKNYKPNNCVLQPWVCELSMMKQSVLITACRGADGLQKYHISKYMLRWLRRCFLYSAFDKEILNHPQDKRGGNFTGAIPEIMWNELRESYLHVVDEIPHHFHLHIMHASEIMGYDHSVKWIAKWWLDFYLMLVKDAHLNPETKENYNKRLGDNKEDWLNASNPHEKEFK